MAKLQCPHCGFGTMLCYKTIPESEGILFRYLCCPSCGFRARREYHSGKRWEQWAGIVKKRFQPFRPLYS